MGYARNDTCAKSDTARLNTPGLAGEDGPAEPLADILGVCLHV